MITRADLVERAREWSLREDVVEKDYMLGWLLWAIGSEPGLMDRWVFKGGTCLKKCYLETYRFSEDLDFTVLPGPGLSEEGVIADLVRCLTRAEQASGIDFAVRAPRLRSRPDGHSMEGRVYYRGPRASPEASSVKIDLTLMEHVARPPVLRPIAHPYPDVLPAPGTVRAYSFEELFAEKLRAMGERGRPRDLYDIVNLYWRPDLRQHAGLIRTVLVEKCESKGVPVPTTMSLEESPWRDQLQSEWVNMLGHQLPALPDFSGFWAEIPGLFSWLEGTATPEPIVDGYPVEDIDDAWTPPATAWTWGLGVPFESIRFAASNRLCVALGYAGRVRSIEPYSLRRSRAGNILLHALHAGTMEHRSYRIDRIHSIGVTTQPFRPRYRVELAQSGPLSAPPVRSGPRRRRATRDRRRR